MHNNIRLLQTDDIKTVRYICGALNDNLELSSMLFCDYYIEHKTNLCFIAVDEFNNPCGCILATDNYFQYKEDFVTYLEKIKSISYKTYRHYISLQKKLTEVNLKYPSHFTIAVLPAFRNHGCGKQLFDTLVNKLISLNIKGINIILNKNNTGSISFFERLGFEKYKKLNKNEFIYIYDI